MFYRHTDTSKCKNKYSSDTLLYINTVCFVPEKARPKMFVYIFRVLILY